MEDKPDEEFLERLKIVNLAVKKAQELNWEKGFPNVYSKNKKIVYEYPDPNPEGEGGGRGGNRRNFEECR